jgi:hypothetical protein
MSHHLLNIFRLIVIGDFYILPAWFEIDSNRFSEPIVFGREGKL